ncbi:MAG: cyclic 2,3-diphosphoglycerate synthase [Polyangiaceae bacterium]|nr:cyclic 2,3-diphosphoglycerate synthase [Polyangiaceae bacterium]
MSEKRVLILGAAGRDFHNFLVACRDDPTQKVVAFTATQIPDIDGRCFPASLAGPLYPEGIPIVAEDNLETIIKEKNVDECVFAYSDVPHTYVMHMASRVHAAGPSFRLMGPNETMIKSIKPIISICAVRTGCGKSQTSRRVVKLLRDAGKRVVSIRHPMPYGDLAAQRVQRFATLADMDTHKCTIEEREEYEPHVELGAIIYSGVDYTAILREAEKEADVIIWDGGNNDFSFYRPDIEIAVVDPLRPGHELSYHPGETVVRRAHVVVINKVKQAKPEDVDLLIKNIASVNPNATVIKANSPITLDNEAAVKGKKVIVVEDGPTLTHGGMAIGAGWVVAQDLGCKVVSPRKYAVGTIAATYNKYSQTENVLPAMGYSEQQLADLNETIAKTVEAEKPDAVLSATPIDLAKLIKTTVPMVRASYELEEISKPDLADILAKL